MFRNSLNDALRTVAVAAMLLPISARAETEIGNGGDAIVCPNRSPEMYDAFQARVLMGLTPNFGTVDDPVAMAKFAIHRLDRFDPIRAARFTKIVETLIGEARLLDDASLHDIPDTDPSAIPAGCELTQLAIQYRDPAPRMPHYLIDNSIWTQMDHTQRAYLLIHEAIYHETVRRGAQNSVSARYFNAILSSNLMDTWTQEDYDHFIAENVELPLLIEHRGITLDKATAVWDDQGVLLSAKMVAKEVWSSDIDRQQYVDGSRTIYLEPGTDVQFDAQGAIAAGDGRVEGFNGSQKILRMPVAFESGANHAKFVINGSDLTMKLEMTNAEYGKEGSCRFKLGSASGTFLRIDADQMPVNFDGGFSKFAYAYVGTDAECRSGAYRTVQLYPDLSLIELYSNGLLKKGTVYYDVGLLDEAGQIVNVSRGDNLELTENGRLVRP